MSVTCRALPWAGAFVLMSTLAVAQPKPQSQPPQPQDPTPIPAPKPKIVEKPAPEPSRPAPGGRIGGDRAGSELVLSGCLQLAEDPKRPSESAAKADTPPIAAGYVLRHALPVGKGKHETPNTRGKEYRIVASNERVKLSDFAGHQVKVKGRVAVQGESQGAAATESGRSASEPSGATGVSTTPQANTSSTPLVTLTVSEVESIAPSCSTPAS